MPEDRSVLSRPGPTPTTTVAYGPDPDQVIDWYLPPSSPAGPVVVLIHGGYWRPEYDRVHARSAAGGLAEAGFPTALIEYRRIPGRPDTTVSDVESAIRRAAAGSEGGEPHPVLVVGHSAGGHLALLSATGEDLPIAGCLALAPLASLQAAESLRLDDDAVRDFLGGPARQHADLDPCSRPAPTAPVVVLHGGDDSVVPIGISEDYCGRHRAPLVPLAATGHFELIDPTSGAWSAVIGQLESMTAAGGIE